MIESPCNNLCSLDDVTGYCRGCFRNIDEITGWILLGEKEKQNVLKLVKERERKFMDGLNKSGRT